MIEIRVAGLIASGAVFGGKVNWIPACAGMTVKRKVTLGIKPRANQTS